ncbi:hypothetical protein GJ496_009911 [Pomphorhynchus laevis]|nr:hypothetical protein GJ496_009911 [Pomphorhynchus laevis]
MTDSADIYKSIGYKVYARPFKTCTLQKMRAMDNHMMTYKNFGDDIVWTRPYSKPAKIEVIPKNGLIFNQSSKCICYHPSSVYDLKEHVHKIVNSANELCIPLKSNLSYQSFLNIIRRALHNTRCCIDPTKLWNEAKIRECDVSVLSLIRAILNTRGSFPDCITHSKQESHFCLGSKIDKCSPTSNKAYKVNMTNPTKSAGPDSQRSIWPGLSSRMYC